MTSEARAAAIEAMARVPVGYNLTLNNRSGTDVTVSSTTLGTRNAEAVLTALAPHVLLVDDAAQVRAALSKVMKYPDLLKAYCSQDDLDTLRAIARGASPDEAEEQRLVDMGMEVFREVRDRLRPTGASPDAQG
jgi:hypothetical protein